MSQINRLKLDFSLTTNVERKEFLDNYLQQEQFINRPPTPDELEMMANYILWGKDPKTGLNSEQEGLVTIDTKHKTWQKKDMASLDELFEQPTFCETSLSALGSTQYRVPKQVFSRDEALAQCPASMREEFVKLFRDIDKLELQIYYWEREHNKHERDPRPSLLKKFDEEEQRELREAAKDWTQHTYLKKRHLLVELRQEQYQMKDAYSASVQMYAPDDPPPAAPDFGVEIIILPLGLADDGIGKIVFRPFRELNHKSFSQNALKGISDFYWTMRDKQKNVSSNSSSYIDMRDPEHVFQVLNQLCDLEEVAREKSFGSNLRPLLDTLLYYIEQADLSSSQREILQMKLDKKKNVDIARAINEKYKKTYSVNYISTIFRQKIIPKICAAASYHEQVVSVLFFEEEFKQCNCCGETYLLDALNFVRKSRSKDGFSERCKRCDKKIRQEKKDGI